MIFGILAATVAETTQAAWRAEELKRRHQEQLKRARSAAGASMAEERVRAKTHTPPSTL